METFHSFKPLLDNRKAGVLNETTVRLEETMQQYKNQQKSMIDCDKKDSMLARKLTESSRRRILDIVDIRQGHIETMLNDLNGEFQKQCSVKRRGASDLKKAQDIYYKLVFLSY